MPRDLLASFNKVQGHVNAHSHVLPCASPKNMHIGSSLFINTCCVFKGFNEHLQGAWPLILACSLAIALDSWFMHIALSQHVVNLDYLHVFMKKSIHA